MCEVQLIGDIFTDNEVDHKVLVYYKSPNSHEGLIQRIVKKITNGPNVDKSKLVVSINLSKNKDIQLVKEVLLTWPMLRLNRNQHNSITKTNNYNNVLFSLDLLSKCITRIKKLTDFNISHYEMDYGKEIITRESLNDVYLFLHFEK